jgi:hypothetical protein
MNYSAYPIERIGKELTFVFESNNYEGTNPVIKIVDFVKVIRYSKTYYNLEFGDLSVKSWQIDDLVVTNNGDMRKVLRTVAATLDIFFDEYPTEEVHIGGSDEVRHSYYHKLIRDYHKIISIHYEVQGCINKKIEPFEANKEYEFIVVKKL